MSVENLIYGDVPAFENADDILREKVFECGKRIYGKAFENECVQERCLKELELVSQYRIGNLLLHTYDIVKEADCAGYLTSFRGNLGNLYVAFLLGLTDVNPLPVHYYCRYCGKVEFSDDGTGIFAERKTAECPDCGKEFTPDGYNLSYIFFADPQKATPSNICIDVPCELLKKTGCVRLDKSSDYKGKLQISPCEQLDMLCMLEKATGVSPDAIPLNDTEVFMQFSEGRAEGFSDGVPLEVMRRINPQNMSELVNAIGILHGINIWKGNQLMLTDMRHRLETMGTLKEDVYQNLISCKIPREKAFEITEEIRRGYLIRNSTSLPEMMNYLRTEGVSESYVDYLSRIRYLYPKGAAIRTARLYYQFAWFKLRYPEEYMRSKENTLDSLVVWKQNSQ